jgi:hypothetical protein
MIYVSRYVCSLVRNERWCAAVTESAFNFKAKIGVLNKVLKGYFKINFCLLRNSGGGSLAEEGFLKGGRGGCVNEGFESWVWYSQPREAHLRNSERCAILGGLLDVGNRWIGKMHRQPLQEEEGAEILTDGLHSHRAVLFSSRCW